MMLALKNYFRTSVKKEAALYLLTLLTSIIFTLNITTALSLFLSHFSAIHQIYTGVAASLAILVFFSIWGRLNVQKPFWKLFPFVYLFLGSGFVFFLYLNSMNSFFLYALLFIVMISPELMRWTIDQLTERYINPASVLSHQANQGLFVDAGKILVIGSILLFPKAPDAIVMFLNLIFISGIVGVCYLKFSDRRLVEIRVGVPVSAETSAPTISSSMPEKESSLFWLFGLMGICWGLFRISQDIAVSSFYKMSTGNASQDIKTLITWALGVEAILSFGLRFVNASVIEKSRVSPIPVLVGTWVVLGISAVAILWFPEAVTFVLFAGITKGFNGVYLPTMRRISWWLSAALRTKARIWHSLAVGAVAGVISTLFIGASQLSLGFEQKSLLMSLLFGTPILALFIIPRMKVAIVKVLESGLQVEDREVAIRSAIGLSYMRPPEFVQKMKEVLEKNPKTMLRKNILLSLGYSKDEHAVDILLNQFSSEKEEIQISVLDALKVAGSFGATRFTLDLVLSNRNSLSPRVRLNAARMVAGLYGKKGIPILMLGLKDTDPRQLANVLEALSTFNEPELFPIFESYLNSTVPRVRANALVGISHYSRGRALFRQEVEKTFANPDLAIDPNGAPILYVIGRSKDRQFTETIGKLLESRKDNFSKETKDQVGLSFLQTLAWAAIRHGNNLGYHCMLDLLMSATKQGKDRSVLHFFMQLEDYERMNCIEEWIENSEDPQGTCAFIKDTFKASGLNFVEELAFAHSLTESVLLSRQKAGA